MGGGLVSLHLKQNQCKYNIYNFDGFIQYGGGGGGLVSLHLKQNQCKYNYIQF